MIMLMDRRTFLNSAALAGMAPSPARFELEEATAADLAEGMRRGRWTARALTEQYLARIAALDRRAGCAR